METYKYGSVGGSEKLTVAIWQSVWFPPNYSTVRLEVRRAETLKQGNDMVGNKTKIKVVKNKVAPPFRTAEVDIMYGEGISKEGEIIDLGSELDIVQKSGSWYSYNDERLGQGRENAKLFLKENPDIRLEIQRKIRDHYGLDAEKIVTESDDAEQIKLID